MDNERLPDAMRDVDPLTLEGRGLSPTSSGISVPPTKLARWRAAAAATDLDFDGWVLSTLDCAADDVLRADE
ncbi:hypothetical protein [Actinoplanes palleronii]|uniref:Uncharacterized protein n=1 Tax=Actinoplanes palleronii TaxID=113570 RepID=A0ABQ4BK27_9ACTN|nr:hypothetical protein [Actinoplanes palleronii]GIE70646.1 hypothetical protein Apa02nite_067540 [Actinoplanes palleronii]